MQRSVTQIIYLRPLPTGKAGWQGGVAGQVGWRAGWGDGPGGMAGLVGWRAARVAGWSGGGQGQSGGEVWKTISVGHRLKVISRIQEKTVARNFCSFSSKALQ